MAWWRRDPYLFSHSPVHRYAQRILRDHEAALRTRSFSRTPTKPAQHKDDGDSKRPADMSNLEWMQLQHYERWRKRLQEDPYKTLFGASNDMLSGKGLNNWEWVHKSFPKWMLRDMDVDEQPQEESRGKSAQPKYPKKVNIKDENDTVPKTHGSPIPQSSFRLAPFEREESEGIVSPSDLRRPREGSHVKVVGQISNDSMNKGPTVSTEAASRKTSTIFVPPAMRSPLETTCTTVGQNSEHKVGTHVTTKESRTGLAESSSHGEAQVAARAFGTALDDTFPNEMTNFVTNAHRTASESSLQNEFKTEEAAAREFADMRAFGEKIERLKSSYAEKKAAPGEPTFVEEFLNSKAEGPDVNTVKEDRKAWRQTAMQRRVASESAGTLQAQSSATPSWDSVSDNRAPARESTSLPPYQESEVVIESQAVKADDINTEPLVQQEPPIVPKEASKQGDPSSARSVSAILNQLPKDDLDFLSAADIRASMGAKRSRIPTNAQKEAKRQDLERAFAAAHDAPNIDSMIEASIVNNQYVRRVERKMRNKQIAQEVEKTSFPTDPISQDSAGEAPIESSIDRMKKWLETTGASFAKQFWQDPTEEADVTKTKLFFDKIAHYLKKGQAANRQITEDLEKDIPASMALLKRLKNDEELLDSAIHRLRQRYSSGNGQSLTPRKIRAMESLKTRFHQTNLELEKAYAALHELAGTEPVANATGSFKRRLTAASKVLHKNAQLLRMLVWSLQTRLEDSKIDRNMLSNYKIVADNLLSLRDTQMTLIRVVDRAMLTYGVVPTAADNSDTSKAGPFEFASCEDPFVRARLAADAHLINEIQSHKSATQEHSNDGNSCAPKPTTSTTLDEPSPLTHSLFRPFGPAIEKLGSRDVPDLAAEGPMEIERRKLSDVKLVDKVKKAYEDDYGTSTADHSQVASVAEEVEGQTEKDIKKFEMLKDDLVARSFELENSEAAPSSDMTTHTATGTNVRDNLETSISTPSEAVTSNQPTTSTISAANTPAKAESVTEPLDISTFNSSTAYLSTHYTIVIRDPHTDTMSITTSSTGPPRDTSPAVPLHQALAALDSPARFVPHIAAGQEVVSAKKDILVLRDALDSDASTRTFETISTSKSGNMEEAIYSSRDSINPIDGTARLSPTGYVGPEESPEHIESEFEERRHAAGRFNLKEAAEEQKPIEKGKRVKKRGGAGSVVKTAIWVAGICYVVGVVGEIATAPF